MLNWLVSSYGLRQRASRNKFVASEVRCVGGCGTSGGAGAAVFVPSAVSLMAAAPSSFRQPIPLPSIRPSVRPSNGPFACSFIRRSARLSAPPTVRPFVYPVFPSAFPVTLCHGSPDERVVIQSIIPSVVSSSTQSVDRGPFVRRCSSVNRKSYVFVCPIVSVVLSVRCGSPQPGEPIRRGPVRRRQIRK